MHCTTSTRHPHSAPAPAPPPQVVIFPKTPEHLKTSTAEEAFNPDGLAQRSISLLKDQFPDLEVGAGLGWVGGCSPGGGRGGCRGRWEVSPRVVHV